MWAVAGAWNGGWVAWGCWGVGRKITQLTDNTVTFNISLFLFQCTRPPRYLRSGQTEKRPSQDALSQGSPAEETEATRA